jgi:hypothetical protein
MSNITVAAIMAGVTDGAIMATATVGAITARVIIAVAIVIPTQAMPIPTQAMPILIIILMPILPLTSASVSVGAVGNFAALIVQRRIMAQLD